MYNNVSINDSKRITMRLICNLLTILRLFLIPLIIISFFVNKWLAFYLFILASLTDFLDGTIARTYNCETNLGKILDPIADKLLIISMLVILFTTNSKTLLPGLIIIWREIIVNDFRFINDNVSPSLLSKIKTLVQMLAISLLILPQQPGFDSIQYGLSMLWLAAGIAILSAISYFLGNLVNK